jgi:hypothetical protein
MKDLSALQKSIAKGIRSAQLGGERVDFRSLNEMLQLESKLKRELGQAGPKRRIHHPQTKTGWR